MSQLVLFSETLEKDACLCIAIEDNQAGIELPILKRSLEEISELGRTREVFVLLPQSLCNLSRVELPWLSDKKARMAIPYALEEQLAQSLTSLHFAFSKQYYTQQQYLVLCHDEARLTSLLKILQEAHISPTHCTSDWFALEYNSIALTPQNLLINTPEFQGALPYHLAEFLPEMTPSEVLCFSDSPSIPSPFAVTAKIDDCYHQWAAKKVVKAIGINLLQGAFSYKQKSRSHTKLYTAVAALVAVWIVSFFGVDLWNFYRYRQENLVLNTKIEVLYRNFFPNATQVVNPRFRIGRALKDQGSTQENALWRLLAAIIAAVDTQAVSINSLRYQNDTIRLSLSAPTFEQLEKLQDALQAKSVSVRQSNASSQENAVTANLELRL